MFISGGYTLSAAFIWGINTLFLLDTGMSIAEVFMVNGAFSAGIVLFELPTGIVADTVGRRISFLASVLVLCLTTIAYVVCPYFGGGFWAFCIISIFMGLGFTFYSGAVEAWLVDALKASGFEQSLDNVFTKGSFVSGTAMLIGTVTGGFLGAIDLSIPYLIRAALLLIVFMISLLMMKEIGFIPRKLNLKNAHREIMKTAGIGFNIGWGTKPMRFLIIAAAIQGAVLSWVFYAWQPYFMELLQKEVVWVAGVIAALISLSTMVGNAVVTFFMRFCGKRTTLFLWGVALQAVGAVCMGLTSNFYVASACLLLVTGAMGMMRPVRQAFLHQVIPSEQRATVISLDAMVSGMGSAGGQAGLGQLAQVRNFATGYIASGIIFSMAFPVFWWVRKLNAQADKIVGTKIDIKSDCPTQGIPAISQISSKEYSE